MICVGLFVMWCHAAQPPSASAEYCQIAKPITWVKSDTRKTKEQIDRHNRKWKALCGGRK